MKAREALLNILAMAGKIFLKILWLMIIIPLVICAIPFVLIGIGGLDQIVRCIRGTALKRRR